MSAEQQAGGHSLGEMLRAAREARGMDLGEVSRQTAVRRDYLAALEEGRTEDLPEPVYVRNFVKLFARAVGLDANAALTMYSRERQQLHEATEPELQREPERRRTGAADVAGGSTAATRPAAANRRRPADAPRVSLTWLPPLLLVVAVVALAVWGFNSTLFRPGQQQVSSTADTPSSQPESEPEATTPSTVSDTVRLSVTTEPAGARVLVDEFPLEGLTPIVEAPVSARESRLVRVELDGYEPFEAPFDLTFNRNLSFVLQEAQEPVATDSPAGEPDNTAADADGTITVNVSDESWLEIYPGTAREGTPHVYTTASAGDTYTFDLPVYVRVGNAAGVSAIVNGRDIGPLGSAGEITARSFTLDD